MQLGEKLIGKSVISVQDGRVVGSVKELYLDHNLEFMTAIRLSGEGFLGLGGDGLFNRTFELITRDDIVLFGVDVILVKDSGTIINSDQVPALEQWLERSSLKGRAVDTPGGTKIGTIGDVVFDGDGRIIGFRLSRVFVAGPLAKKEVIARDVVVDTGAEDNVLTINLSEAERQELSLDRIAREIQMREAEAKREPEYEVEPEPEYEVEPEPEYEVEPEPDREHRIRMPSD